MKKTNRALASIFASLMMVSSFGACGGASSGDGNDPLKEAIDASRQQLYVFNFAGGYGSDWLVKVKNDYDA